MKNLLLFCCLLAQVGFSQTNRIDSLKRELGRLSKEPDTYTRDTLQYTLLKALMKAYVDVSIDSSAYYNRELIRLCENRKLQDRLIYAYQYAGYLYQIRGDQYQNILLHYKALSLAEELKEYSRMATSYGRLAHAYATLKEFGKALKLCKQGLAVLYRHPDTYAQLEILNVQGEIYREQGQLTNALNVNQDMYRLAAKRYPWYEAQGLQAIGWVYKEMGNMGRALDYYKKALIICRKKDNILEGRIDLEGNILVNIADTFIRMKKWQEALNYCLQAKQMAMTANNSSIVREADETLYKIFKHTNRPADALKAYEDFVFLKDSLSKENNKQRIKMLNAEYDNVQKTSALQRQQQQSNILLLGILAIFLIAGLLFWNNRRLTIKNYQIDQQRTLLEAAREQLANANKTLETRVDERTKELVKANQELIQKNEEIKAALFKGQTIERKRVALELHDNLSSLLSAVNMSIQTINPQNLSESEQSVYRNVRYLLQNAYAEVRNISHNILPAELEREGLVATLNKLISQLNQNSPLQFSLTITGLQDRLPIEIEFNVYSIVFELINNAIKHAKATIVLINLSRTNIGVDLLVTDNGIGLGQHSPKRGIGLQNIQTRLDSLGGTFTVLLPTEKGVRILIKIPIETNDFNGNFYLA